MVSSDIYCNGLTPEQVRRRLDGGYHINGKVITDEALDAWLSVRRQYNKNLRAKMETEQSRDMS